MFVLNLLKYKSTIHYWLFLLIINILIRIFFK